MNIENFLHKEFNLKPNKFQMKPNELAFKDEDIDKFNEIYQYAKANFLKVEPTKSGGIPYNNSVKHHNRYMLIKGKSSYELTIVCHLGCYRFIIGHLRNIEKNPVNGKAAVRAIYKKAKEENISLKNYIVDKETGLKIKETIEPPHIEMYGLSGRVYTNVHHLDLNSSYASRIIEKYPELLPLYKPMYDLRKAEIANTDAYYKHVLTNSIGCMQSQYCPDYNDAGKLQPYQFAGLSKIAVDGTRHLIEYYINKLLNSGRQVLLTNTDGIWYKGDIFHDDKEGLDLCQWKTDHKNCTFLMKSKGAYQYIEDDICHTVLRGTSPYEKEKKREDWEFGEILKITLDEFKFNEDIGVIKHVKKIQCWE